MPKLYCTVRLAPWVEPVIKDLALLNMAGSIRSETLEKVVSLLLLDGMEIGPLRAEEA